MAKGKRTKGCKTYKRPHVCPDEHYSFCEKCRRDKAIDDGVCKFCGHKRYVNAGDKDYVLEPEHSRGRRRGVSEEG